MRVAIFSFYILFLKRAVATAIIFSSLLCWQPSYAAISQYEVSPLWLAEKDVRSRAINSLLARAAGDTYTVPGNDKDTYVPYGILSNIDVTTAGPDNNNISDIQFGTGTVTLTGQNGQLLFNVTTMNHNPRSNEVTVTPNGNGDAILVLAGERQRAIYP